MLVGRLKPDVEHLAVSFDALTLGFDQVEAVALPYRWRRSVLVTARQHQ
jgi:hypothetical protein